jgi:large subunit ribosomal protein L30
MPAKLKVTLVKSTVSHTARTRATVRSLGLRRIGDSVEIADTPEMRGMANAVRFLLRTEETEQAAEPKTAQPKRSTRVKKTKQEASE